MRDLRLTRRSPRRALLGLLTAAVSAMLTAGLSSRAAAQDWETDDWPPRLSEAYPDWKPGDQLIKPIQPHVMRQMANAVLKMADGALAHVDEFIVESKQIQNAFMLEEYVAFRRFSIAYSGDYAPILDILDNAGNAGNGISSISVVRAAMQKHRDRISEIAQRYEHPIEIPHDPDALQTFLTRQAEEARTIHAAVDWFLNGRRYAVQWVLDALRHPDDELKEYQNRVYEMLSSKSEEILRRDPNYSSLSSIEQYTLKKAKFAELRGPYGANEKKLIDQHVARYLRLQELSWALYYQIDAQLVHLVDATPPQWGEIPFYQDLNDTIRNRITGFLPMNHAPFVHNDGSVRLWVYFYTPEDFETEAGTGKFGSDALGLTSYWPTGELKHFPAPIKPPAYRAPPFLALEAAVYPRKPMPGLPLTIGFRIENSSQYTAAGVSVDLTLVDPRTEHAPRNLVCQTDLCEDLGDGKYRCFLGDMNPSEVSDLLFHAVAPMTGMVIWTANLQSAGDLGGPLASCSINQPTHQAASR